jgi:hypothetical protein
MKKIFKEIALQVGGSHYPEVGGELLQKFGEMVVQRCIDIIQSGDYRDSTLTTYDQHYNPRIVQQCIENIKENFEE